MKVKINAGSLTQFMPPAASGGSQGAAAPDGPGLAKAEFLHELLHALDWALAALPADPHAKSGTPTNPFGNDGHNHLDFKVLLELVFALYNSWMALQHPILQLICHDP